MGYSTNKIVILGCGFAGMSAARYLAKHRPQSTEITVIDNGHSTYRPMLPDVVAGRVSAQTIQFDYKKQLQKTGINQIESHAKKIDTNKKTISLTNKQIIPYTHLLLCCGSVPALSSANCFNLMEIEDALAIQKQLLTTLQYKKQLTALVVGAGYTGIELITAIKALCKKKNYPTNHLQIAERGKRLIATVGNWEQKRTVRGLQKAAINIIHNATIQIEKKSIKLNGTNIDPEITGITTGVKAVAGMLLPTFAEQKSKRLHVDQYLKVTDGIYAAGDSVYFDYNREKPLRQSVNFAITQGKTAARNILQEIAGKQPRPYKPKDLGFVIPNYAIKKAYGRSGPLYLGGRFGMLSHYFMCVLRAFSWKQRWKMIRELLFGVKDLNILRQSWEYFF